MRQLVMPGLDQRARIVTVDAGPPVAGYVLDDGQYRTLEQPLTHGSAEARGTVAAAASAGPAAALLS